MFPFILTAMTDKKSFFPPPLNLQESAHVNQKEYQKLYQESVNDPEGFWKKVSARLDWFTTPKTIKNTSFSGDVSIQWFEDGVLNACYNCVDRHLPEKAQDTALIWEGDDPNDHQYITYQTLKDKICQLSNALLARGVKKGDRVTILYAYGGRGSLCHAGLCAYRGGTFCCLWWIFG